VALKEEFNIKITEVNPAYSSQTCPTNPYFSKELIESIRSVRMKP